MAKTKAPLPSEEVTADEVKGWFPKSIFGDPNTFAIHSLAKAIECTRWFRQLHDGDGHLIAGAQELPFVARSANALLKDLTQLKAKAGSYGNSPEINNLTTALEDFLRVAPARKQQRPKPIWLNSAAEWAPWIVKCLEQPDKEKPSLTKDDGPVVAVLGKAILRVYGKEVEPENIGRRLRNLKPEDIGRSSKATTAALMWKLPPLDQ